jgi:hypothetical protein
VPAKRTLLLLAGVGIASGFLSALFGVGGGVVVVPALVLLLGFDSKSATATSLAAIGITAVAGAFSFSLFDHVHWGKAALVGLPALAGSLVGVRQSVPAQHYGECNERSGWAMGIRCPCLTRPNPDTLLPVGYVIAGPIDSGVGGFRVLDPSQHGGPDAHK